MTTLVRLGRAAAAAAAIVAIVAGVPGLLWALGGRLFATGWLTWRNLGELASRPDDGRLLLTLLLIVAVLAWALLTYSILAEFLAALVRKPAPRINLPGFRAGRALAAVLVGTILGAGSTPAWAAPLIPVGLAGPHVPPPGEPATTHPAVQALDDTREYVVKEGDTLWDIAEDELGDPLRWREILRLSADRVQSDGGRVSESGLLHVGWVLSLPTDDPAHSEARKSVIVRHGDTLSGIAAREYDDPTRASDIFALNHDRRQPDGGHLESPDLILPGWTLEFPEGSRIDHAAAPPIATPRAEPPSPGAPPSPGVLAPTPSHAADAPDARASSASSAATTSPAAPTTSAAEPRQTSQPRGTPPAMAPGAETDEDTGTDAASVLVPVSIAASSVVVAGLVAALAVRRRRQFRYRRQGHRIAVPDERGGRVEWSVTHAERDVDADLLDIALRALVLSNWDGVDAPALRTVVLGPDHVLLTVRAPALLPPPFTPLGQGEEWQLDATAALPLTADEASQYCAPYPALASVATDAHGDVLFADFEEIGVAHITGDPEAATGLLRHIAAELANAPWAEDVDVLLVGFGDELIPLNPDRLSVLPDLSTGIAAVTARLRQAERTLTELQLDSVMQARLRPLAPDAWVPVVLLATGPASDTDRTALEDLVREIGGDRRRPVAVITTRIAIAGHELHIADDGTLLMADAGEGWIGPTMSVAEAADYANLVAPSLQPDVPVGRARDRRPWSIDMNEDGSLAPATGFAHPPGLALPVGATPFAVGEAEGLTSAAAEGVEGTTPDSTPRVDVSLPGPAHDGHPGQGLVVDPPPGVGTTQDEEAAAPADVPDPVPLVADLALARTAPPEAARRLAAVEHNDPGLDEDLRRWLTSDTPEVPLIGILGIPEVRAPGPIPRTRPSWWTEMLVYLALHPIGITLDKALTDLWPDGKQLSDATVRHAFYGARRWAGRGLDGDPEQPFVSEMQRDGVYRMRGHLLDWDLFRRLRKRAHARHAAHHPGAVDDYAAALGLVRGPVLSPLRPHGYAWLTSHPDRLDLQIPGFVVDTAHELVEIALAAADTIRARHAAEIARLVDPDMAFDRPLLDLMRVAHVEGQPSEMERYAVMLLDAREPEDELPDDTFDVLNELVPNMLRRRR